MKLTILGSGSVITDLNHFGPCYLLEHNNKRILIDVGQGAMIQLLKLGLAAKDIDYIFLTHFHCDHTADLLPLLISYRIARRNGLASTKKIKIFGQKGTIEFVRNLFQTFNHKEGEEYEVFEIQKPEIIEGIEITPFPVLHSDVPAIAYRLVLSNKTIAFSGDTKECPGILDASKEADLLVIDCSLPKGLENVAHLNTEQIGVLCKKAGVKKVILSHLTDQTANKNVVSEVRETFTGEVEAARDLSVIKI